MNIVLNPAQQAALDKFEADSEFANSEALSARSAKVALMSAQVEAENTSSNSLKAHQVAVASGQAFVDLMLSESPSPSNLPKVGGTKS